MISMKKQFPGCLRAKVGHQGQTGALLEHSLEEAYNLLLSRVFLLKASLSVAVEKLFVYP